MEDLHPQRHVLKANAVWDLPDFNTSGSGAGMKTVGYIFNDWQLSGVLTANSGTRYDLTYSYQSNGASKNLTGSPDYDARIVYLGDPGSGCSDNQYAQFNVSSVTGPGYNSLGLESGRNLLANCADKTIDLSIARTIRLGGSRQLQFRLDAFNAFNVAIINNRQAQIQFDNPVVQEHPERAVQRGRDGQHDPSAATQRRLRRGNERAGHAQLPGDDSLPVLGRGSAKQDGRGSRHRSRGSDRKAGGRNPTRLFLVRLVRLRRSDVTAAKRGSRQRHLEDIVRRESQRRVSVALAAIALAGAAVTAAAMQKLTPAEVAAKMSGTWVLNRELTTGFNAPKGAPGSRGGGRGGNFNVAGIGAPLGATRRRRGTVNGIGRQRHDRRRARGDDGDARAAADRGARQHQGD